MKEYVTTESERKWHKQYYRKNREKICQRQREYRASHREQIRVKNKEYSMTHDRSGYFSERYQCKKQMAN